MIGAVILIAFYSFIANAIITSLKANRRYIDVQLMSKLFWFHYLMSTVYFIYVLFNRSDSYGYYDRAESFSGAWFNAYTTGTKFIDFVAIPFVQYLGFSYEMMMATFAFFGYLGFVFFYLFFKENIKYKHTLFGYDILLLLLFLPNMHFWTGSLGKGSLIFMGLGMATYGMSNFKKNFSYLIIGLLIVFHIRAHVFLFMSAGMGAGYFFGANTKIPSWQKYLAVVVIIAGVGLLYNTILNSVGLDTENVIESFDKMSAKRAGDLSRNSGSGVDISNYPIPLKLFTFWYRPLFVDSPNVLGIIISLENTIYLMLTAKLFKGNFLPWFAKGSANVKACLLIFLLSSFALSTTMSNLGIIQRQKSMVMYFLFFVILSFLDHNEAKRKATQASIRRRIRNLPSPMQEQRVPTT